MNNLINKIKAFSTKQKIVGCIGSILLIGVITSTIILSTKKDNQNIQLKKETFVVEFGEAYSYKKEHYIKAEKETMKDVKVMIEGVDLDQTPLLTMTKEQALKKYAIGTYKGTAQYKDETVSFKIVIKDTTKPEFTDFKDKIEVTKGSIDDLAKHFTAKDLSESSIEVESSKVDFAVPGEYKATAKATDAHKNKVQKEFTVIVGEKTQAELDSEAQEAEQQAQLDQQANEQQVQQNQQSNSTGGTNQTGGTSGSGNIGGSTGNSGGSTGGGTTPPIPPTPPAQKVCDLPVGNSGQWWSSEMSAYNWADDILYGTNPNNYSGFTTWGNAICGYTVNWR